MAYQSPGVYVEEVPSSVKPISGASTSTAAFIAILPDPVQVLARESDPAKGASRLIDLKLPASKKLHFFTTWSGFVEAFGDLLGDPKTEASKVVQTDDTRAATAARQKFMLAVYGWFNNGGSQCYVVRAAKEDELASVLGSLETLEDVSLLVAPGLTSATIRTAIVGHAAKLGDRFAILDPDPAATVADPKAPASSAYAAHYFPAIRVFDPAAALGGGSGVVNCPPSGHIAGVYARVDATRGVHKAPANETILGAVDVALALSRGDRDKLNPDGVNVLRPINGNVVVWGARTVGGDDNAELKYVNVRRTLIYLRKSIEEGTQWIVFEPNTPDLWQKITRNVSAFLTEVWRSGALFGATAKDAFYVRCNAETNPPASRDSGLVVTEIGVALAKPAEFVVFRISQTAGSAN